MVREGVRGQPPRHMHLSEPRVPIPQVLGALEQLLIPMRERRLPGGTNTVLKQAGMRYAGQRVMWELCAL